MCEDHPVSAPSWRQRRRDRHAAANAVRVIDTDDGLLIIGADTAGRMLELAGRPDEAGDLVVFHAMPLRGAYARRYLP